MAKILGYCKGEEYPIFQAQATMDCVCVYARGSGRGGVGILYFTVYITVCRGWGGVAVM